MTPPSDTVNMSRREAAWFGKFKRAKACHEKHGHLSITKSEKENWDLRRWMIKQRRQLRDPAITVPKERLELLESIGLNSTRRVLVRYDQLWKTMFDRAKAYYDKHKHLSIPKSDKSNKDLFHWISKQRGQLRDPAITVPKERLELLESIKFNSIRRHRDMDEEFWEKRYSEREEDQGTPGLAEWISRQKRLMASGKIDPARRIQLEELGFPHPDRSGK